MILKIPLLFAFLLRILYVFLTKKIKFTNIILIQLLQIILVIVHLIFAQTRNV